MSNQDTIQEQEDEAQQVVQTDESPNPTEAKLQEYLSGWKRALADYDNLKKETAQYGAQMREFQIMNFFSQLLPIVDLYETALAHVPPEQQKQAWFEGFRQIHVQLQQFIKDNDVMRVDAEGSFNPNSHEAVETQSNEDHGDGDILTVLSPGYTYKDKLLRPARVVVNKLANK